MDSKIQKTINGIGTWENLKEFEVNARRLGRFDDKVAAAVTIRYSELGRALIARYTKLDLSNLNAAEEKIVAAVSAYVGIKKAKGSHTEYTFKQIRNRGLIGAAESAVSRSSPTEGFQTLVEADKGGISYEQIVLDHPEFFSERAAWYARKALGFHNETVRPPASEFLNEDGEEGDDREADGASKPRNVRWSRDELI